MSIRKAVVGAVVIGMVGVAAPIAFADPPGGGDKQCIPGLNPQPVPGQKGGSCPGQHHHP
jgi:hypothetical protein